MSTYRARSSCPGCGQEEEVWFYNSKIEPIDVIQCTRCTLVFDPADFISCFLELYQNVTISAQTVVSIANV